MQNFRLRLQGELEHVHHPEHRTAGGLDRVFLIMDRRGRAGEIVNLVELPPERLRDVVQHERETLIVEQIVDVLFRAGEEIVERGDLVAVREQTAAEMARGVRERLGASVGVSATGIAGPLGGSEETPVGTVFIGISTEKGEKVRRLSLSPMRSRDYIRIVSAANAYDMILKAID